MSETSMSQALVASNFPIPSAIGSLDAYIGAVHQIPVLSVEDEQALARRYREEEDLDALDVAGVLGRSVERTGLGEDLEALGLAAGDGRAPTYEQSCVSHVTPLGCGWNGGLSTVRRSAAPVNGPTGLCQLGR